MKPRIHLLLVLIIFLITILSFENFSSFCQQQQEEEQQAKTDNEQQEKTWQWCVTNIGKFYKAAEKENRKVGEEDFSWTEEGEKLCGFRTMTVSMLRKEAFFPDDDMTEKNINIKTEGEGGENNIDSEEENINNINSRRTTRHTFVGDSTSLRAYAQAVNSFLPPNQVSVGKVRQSPLFLITEQKEGGREEQQQQQQQQDATITKQKKLLKKRSTEIRFSRLVHISLWEYSLNWTLLSLSSSNNNNNNVIPLNSGLISMSLGNWDLNWRLQPDYVIPNFPGGRRRNFPAAIQYWTKNNQDMFNFLNGYFMSANNQNIKSKKKSPNKKKTNNKPPIIIIKEQLMPNCNAPRFGPKKMGRGKFFHRHCDDQIRPLVVPLYRRVVSALAWSRNIPVIPFDFLMAAGVPSCQLGDGIHLDASCMKHEQQLIWNVYLLLKRRKVVQGNEEIYSSSFPSSSSSSSLENSGDNQNSTNIINENSTSSSTTNNENNISTTTTTTTSDSTNKNNSPNTKNHYLTAIQATNETLYNQWWCSRDWDPCEGKLVPPQITFPSPTTTTTTTTSTPSATSSSSSSPSRNDEDVPNKNKNNNNNQKEGKQKMKQPSLATLIQPELYNKSPPVISDIFTLVLIVLVPMAAYMMLRSVSSSS